MRIFDRYIILNFLKNYVLSFVVLVGLYIALDMVFNFDDLTKGSSVQALARDGQSTPVLPILSMIAGIADFYFYQMFAFFVQLSGIIPVVAAAFTLVRMTRFNELTAMLAAGVPMLRIASPIIFMGVLLSALLVVDQELIIPQITHKLVREHDEVSQTRASSFAITAMEDESGSLLVASRYNPPGPGRDGVIANATMDRLDIIQFTRDYQPLAHIQARSAVYDPVNKLWLLTDGKRQTGLRPDDAVTTRAFPEWKTDIGPDEIALYRRASYVELLSTAQINTLLEHPRNYGTMPLLRVKHWRFVQPLANIILLLLAIPCVLTREPHSVKRAISKTVLLTGGCLATMFISHQLAGRSPTPDLIPIWPAIMLWLPVFIFGPLAVYLLDRVKT